MAGCLIYLLTITTEKLSAVLKNHVPQEQMFNRKSNVLNMMPGILNKSGKTCNGQPAFGDCLNFSKCLTVSLKSVKSPLGARKTQGKKKFKFGYSTNT